MMITKIDYILKRERRLIDMIVKSIKAMIAAHEPSLYSVVDKRRFVGSW